MEAGLRTPLLDFFRRGDVARDVRLEAATGAFAPRPIEQLGLLMVLAADSDSEVRATADATLARIPSDLIAGFIARSDVPVELRTFFEKRGIQPAATPSPDQDSPFPDGAESDPAFDAEPQTEQERASLLQQLTSMSVPEKVRAAMKGSREMRSLLIRDPNKLVAMAVLSSPKLTESEVESFARMGSVTDEILRTIGQTRAWTKNYGVVLGLVKNAKTPLAVSLTLMPRLNDRDMRSLSTDRNVPEALRISARKRVALGSKGDDK